MYNIYYDSEKNRIYSKVEGTLTEDEIKSYANGMISAIDRTSPGFTVCADHTGCEMNFPELSDKLLPVRVYAANKGLKDSAAVVREEFIKIHIDTPFRGLKNVFASLDHAEYFLDNLKT